MSRPVKLALYIVCVLGVIVFGTLTMRAYRAASKSAETRKASLGHITDAEVTNAAPITNSTEVTNSPAVDTNAIPADAAVPEEGDTNLVATVTNAPASNAAPSTASQEGEPDATSAGGTARGYARMVTYGLGLFVCVLGLAILVGYEVAHFFGQRAEEALFSSEGQPVDPEYEKAEQLWNDGKYLDAVRAMREYLEKNPREQYVALRIAEIYESNLNNPLAAALEYEEVLKKKLPPERWGWAAIHLANLYSGKLGKPDKSIELLRRIDAEYGTTSAAKKARERLLQVDPDFVPSAAPQAIIEQAAEPTEIPETRPDSNLPPGFRPKK
jgi:TolA-binding protein